MMIAKRLALCLAISLFIAPFCFATEFGVKLGTTNLDFLPSQAVPMTVKYAATNFVPDLDLYMIQNFSEGFQFKLGYMYDPTLRSMVYTRIEYNAGFAKIAFGPYFGLFNSSGTPLKSGLSSFVSVYLSGIAFFSFQADSTLGANLVRAGDYSQEQSVIEAGFYVPNAICSLKILTKQYTERLTDTVNAVTSFQEYAFIVDIFKKNSPYSLLVKFAYQSNSKSFTGAIVGTDTIGAIVLGTNITMNLNADFSLMVDFSAGVYAFGIDNLAGALSPGLSDFFFNARIGCTFRIDEPKSEEPDSPEGNSTGAPEASPATPIPAAEASPSATPTPTP